jgi:hypothetical protein
LSVLGYTYLYSISCSSPPLFPSPHSSQYSSSNIQSFLFSSIPPSPLLPYSFYTCRYLHILIYILSVFQISDPACFIGGMSRVVIG